MALAFVSIGSNIDPERNVRAAITALAARTRVRALSTVYDSEPEGPAGQPRFYNCVAAVNTRFSPFRFKYGTLRGIEAELGRRRTPDKYAPRTIDLDLVLYDNLVTDSNGLVLPDPEIRLRPFLAVPLSELAPDLKYPGTGLRMADIAADLSREGLRPLAAYTAGLQADLAAEFSSVRR